MFEAEITKLLENVQARSASIRAEGDRLAIYNASHLPSEIKEEIRRLKPQLLSKLKEAPEANLDPIVKETLNLFDGRIVSVMSVEEYQETFTTIFPETNDPIGNNKREPTKKSYWRN